VDFVRHPARRSVKGLKPNGYTAYPRIPIFLTYPSTKTFKEVMPINAKLKMQNAKITLQKSNKLKSKRRFK